MNSGFSAQLRSLTTVGLVVASLVGGAVLAASCGPSPSVVGTTRTDWRPVGCPQIDDPLIYFAEADGDIYKMDPGNFLITRIGAVNCAMAGKIFIPSARDSSSQAGRDSTRPSTRSGQRHCYLSGSVVDVP